MTSYAVLKKKQKIKEDERQIASSGDSRIKRILDCLTALSIPTVRSRPGVQLATLKALQFLSL